MQNKWFVKRFRSKEGHCKSLIPIATVFKKKNAISNKLMITEEFTKKAKIE